MMPESLPRTRRERVASRSEFALPIIADLYARNAMKELQGIITHVARCYLLTARNEGLVRPLTRAVAGCYSTVTDFARLRG